MITYNSIGCADTTTQSFQINPSPVANFSVANNESCVPFTVDVHNTSVYADSYQWYINNN